MRHGEHRGMGNIGLWILATTMIVIPLFQLLSGKMTSPIWSVLSFSVLGIGIALLVVIPWRSSQWARRILRTEKHVSPTSVVSLVRLSNATEATRLAVLVADQSGVRFVGRSGPIEVFDWKEVSAVRVANKSAVVDAPIIALIAYSGEEIRRFVPLSSQIAGPATGWDADELCRALERCRRQSPVG